MIISRAWPQEALIAESGWASLSGLDPLRAVNQCRLHLSALRLSRHNIVNSKGWAGNITSSKNIFCISNFVGEVDTRKECYQLKTKETVKSLWLASLLTCQRQTESKIPKRAVKIILKTISSVSLQFVLRSGKIKEEAEFDRYRVFVL